jgi:hypothetical protein
LISFTVVWSEDCQARLERWCEGDEGGEMVKREGSQRERGKI